MEFDSHLPVGSRRRSSKLEPERQKTMISPALSVLRPSERSLNTKFQPLLRTPAVGNENTMEIISKKKITFSNKPNIGRLPTIFETAKQGSNVKSVESLFSPTPSSRHTVE